MDTNQPQRIELEGFGMKIKMPGKKAAEVIALLSLVAVIALGAAVGLHMREASAGDERNMKQQGQILEAIKTEGAKNVQALERTAQRQTELQTAMYRVLVESACLQRFAPDAREGKVQFCKDMSARAVP